jgi:prevent-host-death family protein
MQNLISKSKLKAKMLEVFRQVEASGEAVIVTDHGKPVLKIIPIEPKTSITELFGNFQGKVSYLEDLNQPTVDEWGEV